MDNPVIQTLLKRKSVRKYTQQKPTDEISLNLPMLAPTKDGFNENPPCQY